MNWLKKKKIRSNMERLITGVLLGISMLSIILAAGIFFWLLKNGLSVLGIEFLLDKTSVLEGKSGIREYLWNTVSILILTLSLTGCIGVMTAVYLCEYVKREKVKQAICIAIEVLSGIPSIVFGMFGMVFFGEIMNLGYSILNGALTLTIMILPIMITNTQEALLAVPSEYRLGALALGAGKWQMVWSILLPEAVNGIWSGVTLSAGKVLGEAAALLFTAGSKGSLAVGIYMFIGKGRLKEASGTALILLGLVFILHLLQQYIKEKQRY